MNEERPIEKLLRRYAKQRADEAGSPPDLHPATRGLLQGEVARQFGQPRPAGRRFWALLRTRWAFGAAVAAIVLITGAFLLPSLRRGNTPTELAQAKEELKLAKAVAPPKAANAPTRDNLAERELIPLPEVRPARTSGSLAGEPNDKSRAITATAAEPSPTPGPPGGDLKREARAPLESLPASPAAPTVVVRSRTESVALATPTPAERGLGTEEAAPKSATAPRAELAAAALAQRDAALATSTVAPGHAGGTKPAVDERSTRLRPDADATARSYSKTTLARGGGLERDRPGDNSQRFANLSQAAPTGKAADRIAPPVLQDFQVTQSGNEVRVIDQDGSVYLGVVEEFTDADRKKVAAAPAFAGQAQTGAKLSDKDRASQQAETPVAYRVTGTNRTLNQAVVFTWNFVDATNAVAQARRQPLQKAFNNANNAQSFPELLQNSAINGRAQIQAGREFEVNAVPVQNMK